MTIPAACPVDRGREAAYAAEDAAFGGTDLEEAVPLAMLVALVRELVEGDWWRACGGPAVEVVGARTGARSSSARPTGDGVVVRVAAGQWTPATVAHELGHALAGIGHGHDATFRAAHLDVVAVLFGGAQADVLGRRYVDHAVAPGRRRWARPYRGVGAGFVILPG